MGKPGRKKKFIVAKEHDRGMMLRKNFYLSHFQNNMLKRVYRKYGKSEAAQIREALILYFRHMGVDK